MLGGFRVLSGFLMLAGIVFLNLLIQTKIFERFVWLTGWRCHWDRMLENALPSVLLWVNVGVLGFAMWLWVRSTMDEAKLHGAHPRRASRDAWFPVVATTAHCILSLSLFMGPVGLLVPILSFFLLAAFFLWYCWIALVWLLWSRRQATGSPIGPESLILGMMISISAGLQQWATAGHLSTP
jgi:hypothetical protein